MIDGIGREVSDIDKEIIKLNKQREILISKGLKSSNVDDVLFAETRVAQALNRTNGGKSYIMTPDKFFGVGDTGFIRPPKLDFDILRRMSRTPLVKAIIGTKLSEIDLYSSESSDDNSIGWRIRRKTSMFDDEDDIELTDEDKRIVEELTNHLIDGGAKGIMNKEPIRKWLAYQTKDSQELDQATFEVIRDRANRVLGYKSVDASTICYSDPVWIANNLDKIEKIKGEYPSFVQIYDGNKIYTDFYSWEMSMGIRNLSTDVNRLGYGTAELEDLIQTVTWMMNSEDYNGRFFRQGSTPKGLLLVKDGISSPALRQFKDDFNAQLTGVENSWRSFVLEAENAQWINMQQSNNDMQFSAWLEYLIRITCANFKVDPSEVGFHMSGKTQGDAYSSHKQRTDYSKEKSLFPMLQFHQERMNWYLRQYLESRKMPLEYEFIFTGLSPQDEGNMIEHDIKRVSNWLTVNEIRSKRGLTPIDGGDIVLNSIYLQNLSMSAMGAEAEGGFGGDDPYSMFDEDDVGGSQEPTDPYDLFDEDDVMKSMAANPIMLDTMKWIKSGAKPSITNAKEILLKNS